MASLKHRTSQLRIAGTLIAVLLLFALLAWLGHLVFHGIRLARTGQETQQMLESGNFDAQNAGSLLRRAAGDLTAIHGDLSPLFPVFNRLTGIPWFGRYLGQIEPILEYAMGLCQGGDRIFQSAGKLWLEPQELVNADIPMTRRIMQALGNSTTELQASQDAINRAASFRQKIAPDLLPQSFQSYFQKIDQNFDLIQQGSNLLPLLPGILGESQPQTYLVLAQNRDELRATGGFISGIGKVTFSEGLVTGFDIGDVYSIDDFSKPYPYPPDPIQKIMMAAYWVARDGNWSPDFPTAATRVQELYALSTNNQTQGVVAFDQVAVQMALEVLGPIRLPGYPQEITAVNVEDYMHASWAPDPNTGVTGEWWLNRKNFMGDLGKVLMNKALGIKDQAVLIDLARQVLSAIKAGHLQVFFNNQAVQQAVARAGLEGGVHPGGGDYLMLVDWNMGYNKTDPLMVRSVDYEVDLRDPGHPQGRITIRYQNTVKKDVPCKHEATYGDGSYQDQRERCYWNYWRVYKPAGTYLIGYTAPDIPAAWLMSGKAWPGQVAETTGERDSVVLGGFIVVPTNSKGEISLTFGLPGTVLQKMAGGAMEYQLHLQKQAGLDQLPVRVTLKIPSNYIIDPENKVWRTSEGGVYTWEKAITQDDLLSVILYPGVGR